MHRIDGGQVDAGILADGGVRAAAGFHAHDAFRHQRAGAGQKLRILAGVDVVGDGGDVVMVAHRLAQPVGQRGLAGADRAANADAQGTVVTKRSRSHERNNLV